MIQQNQLFQVLGSCWELANLATLKLTIHVTRSTERKERNNFWRIG